MLQNSNSQKLSADKKYGLGSCDQLPIRIQHTYHKETMNQKWKAQQHQFNKTWPGYTLSKIHPSKVDRTRKPMYDFNMHGTKGSWYCPLYSQHNSDSVTSLKQHGRITV